MYNADINHPIGGAPHRFLPDGTTQFWSSYSGAWRMCDCTRKNVRADGRPVVTLASTWAEPVEML